MKIFIILLIFLNLSLYGATKVEKAVFESGVSLYGKVGTAQLTYQENSESQTYSIKVEARSSGILKALFNNRVDTFISEGKINNGVYVPLKYIKKEQDTFSKKNITYLFDYSNSIVHKITQKKFLAITKQFDPMQMKIVEDKKYITRKSTKDIPLVKNDFLSLYLNLKNGNLALGDTKALDQKKGDSVSLINKNTLSINKNNKEDIYKIVLENDEKSMFFKKAIGELALFGHAYLEKISQTTELVKKNQLLGNK